MKKFIVCLSSIIVLINFFVSCASHKNSATSIYDDVYLDPSNDRAYFYDDKKKPESADKKTVQEVNRQANQSFSNPSFNSPYLMQSNYCQSSYLNMGLGFSSMFGLNSMFPGYGIYNAYQLPGSYFSLNNNGLMPFYSNGFNNPFIWNDPFYNPAMNFNNPFSYSNYGWNSFYNNYSLSNYGFNSPYYGYNSMFGTGLFNSIFWSSQNNMHPNTNQTNFVHYGPRVSHSGANSRNVINPDYHGERKMVTGGTVSGGQQPKPIVRPRNDETENNVFEPIINNAASENANAVRPRSQHSVSSNTNEEQPVKGKRGRLAQFFDTHPEQQNHQQWNNQSRNEFSQPSFPSQDRIDNGNTIRGSGGVNRSGGNNVVRPRK
jgi:hypothetical protein